MQVYTCYNISTEERRLQSDSVTVQLHKGKISHDNPCLFYVFVEFNVIWNFRIFQ